VKSRALLPSCVWACRSSPLRKRRGHGAVTATPPPTPQRSPDLYQLLFSGAHGMTSLGLNERNTFLLEEQF
jgi:hypothetical protein